LQQTKEKSNNINISIIMKKYEKPFVKESEIELDEILAGSEYQGETNGNNNEPVEGEGTEGGYGVKNINVWE
jgi:hypothetical protein